MNRTTNQIVAADHMVTEQLRKAGVNLGTAPAPDPELMDPDKARERRRAEVEAAEHYQSGEAFRKAIGKMSC